MKDQKKSKKKLGRANPLLYAIAYAVVKPIFTKKYNISYDNAIVKDIKGPAVVIATHTSDLDHILSGLTLYPLRPNYIASEHFMRNPKTAILLKILHAIPKKMFTPDISTIRNILRAKKEKSVIVIFPEGRLSAYAHSLSVAEGTAELIKKLGVDLYIWKAAGASLTFPKWRDKGDDRIGKINASVKLLLRADQMSERSVAEIKEIVEGAILHDDELAMAGVEYKSADISRGVDKILFKCPLCMQEGNITAGGGHIRCSCGLDATLDSTYRLHGAPFDRINEWFEWQQASIDTYTESLSSKARLGCCGKDGFMDPEAGEGEIYIDKDVFKLCGTLHGEKVEFSVSPEKLVAFPVTPDDHFDVYHNGELIYIYPQPDPKASIKWVCFLDNLMARKKSEAAESISHL